MKAASRGRQQGALEITIMVNMRGENHREEKKKTWSYQRWGTILPPPWGHWQSSSRDKGVTAEENMWPHIGNYKVERELKDGDPVWDLISFKIKSTLEYKHVKWHWSTNSLPLSLLFLLDTSTCLHTLLIWPLISQAPTAWACLSSLLGGEGFFPNFCQQNHHWYSARFSLSVVVDGGAWLQLLSLQATSDLSAKSICLSLFSICSHICSRHRLLSINPVPGQWGQCQLPAVTSPISIHPDDV